MLVLLIDKDGFERAFKFDEGTLVKYYTGVYSVETYIGRDIDGDACYSKDFGTRLPKGTIKRWTGKDFNKGDEPIKFDEKKSYE